MGLETMKELTEKKLNKIIKNAIERDYIPKWKLIKLNSYKDIQDRINYMINLFEEYNIDY